MSAVTKRLSAIVAILAIAVAAGCSKEPAPNPTATSTGSSPAGTPSTGATTSGPTCDTTPFKTAPIHVSHTVPVPPNPVLTAIRPAQHPECGYDRITFDFTGALPGYDIRYVPVVNQEGSGQPITLPGRRYLLIVFQPAQAHPDGGATISPAAATLNYPMLKAYALAGDFEGHVTIALGLDDEVGVRVGELSGRVYVDVAA
jgi:hypothetical protein